jgi:hypothetical protein
VSRSGYLTDAELVQESARYCAQLKAIAEPEALAA